MNAAFRNQIICTSIGFLTYMLVGITRGFPNFIQQQLSETKDFISNDDISWIASICVLLNPIGSMAAGILMDSYGRIMTLKISTGLLTISWFAIALTSTKLVFFIAFFIVGISIGMSLTSSVYVAEISSNKNRCVLLSLFIVFFTSGILISYIVTYSLSWRNSCWVFVCLSAGTCLFFFFLQETPHWFLKTGRKAEAIRVLREMKKITEIEAEQECNEIIFGLRSGKKKTAFSYDVKKSWKPFLIIVLFQICLQGSGYSLLITYSSKIFENISLPIEKNLMSISYSFAVFISSFFAPFAAIYGSRKTLMTVSSLGTTVMLLLILMCIRFDLTWYIPIEVYSYVFLSTIGIVTLSECLPSELYKTEVRGVMCGITQAFATILQGTLIKIFPFFVTDSSIPVLSTFAAFSFLSFFFGIYILPETKGKTLQEIQDTYFTKKPIVLNKSDANSINTEFIKSKDQIYECEQLPSNEKKIRNLLV